MNKQREINNFLRDTAMLKYAWLVNNRDKKTFDKPCRPINHEGNSRLKFVVLQLLHCKIFICGTLVSIQRICLIWYADGNSDEQIKALANKQEHTISTTGESYGPFFLKLRRLEIEQMDKKKPFHYQILTNTVAVSVLYTNPPSPCNRIEHHAHNTHGNHRSNQHANERNGSVCHTTICTAFFR